MTEPTAPQQGQKPADANLTPEELALIPTSLEDETRDEAEIWSELDEAEGKKAEAAEPTDDAPPFQEGRDGQSDQPGEKAKPAEEAPAGNDAPGKAAPSKEEPQKEAPKADEPDPWADAPPDLKERFDALKAERDKLERNAKSDAGRVSAFQRRINELQAAASAPTKAKGREEPEDVREAIKGLADEFPEIAQPLTKALDIIDKRIQALDERETTRSNAARAELTEIVETETARLESEHADWFDVLSKNGPAFAEWIEDQPRRLREAAARNAETIVDAQAAIEIVGGFKKHLGLADAGEQQQAEPAAPAPTPEAAPAPKPNSDLNDRRRRQLVGTSSPSKSGGRPTVSGIPEDGDPEDLWNAFEALDKAKA